MSEMETIKTVKIPNQGISCYRCKKNIYPIQYPSGGDCITCPLCGRSSLRSNIDDAEYCFDCKIIYKSGCQHAENGCTDNIDYARFIYSIHYGDKTIIGMPKIESEQHAINFLKNYDYTWICMCQGQCHSNQCIHAHYPNDHNVECICDKNLENTKF